ncbi:hypothetical protein WDW89_15525 [Deltaproteobacteria bacterium TL4]
MTRYYSLNNHYQQLRKYFIFALISVLIVSFSLSGCAHPDLHFETSRGMYSANLEDQFLEHLQYFHGVLGYAKKRREATKDRNQWLTYISGILTALAVLSGALNDDRSPDLRNNQAATISFGAGITALASSTFRNLSPEPDENIGQYQMMLTYMVRLKNESDQEVLLCESNAIGQKGRELCDRIHQDKLSMLILEMKERCGALFSEFDEIECFPEKLAAKNKTNYSNESTLEMESKPLPPETHETQLPSQSQPQIQLPSMP